MGLNIETTALIHTTVSSINELADEFQERIDQGAEAFVIPKDQIQALLSLMRTSATITAHLFEGHQKFSDVVDELQKKQGPS